MKITSTLALVVTAFWFTGCFKENSVHTPKANLKSAQVEIKGSTNGYGNLREDGRADFGLILKNFNKQDLFQIELDDLMSTSTDRLSVFGYNLDLPSNVALPDQRERYIFSIRLNKPHYRLYFEPGQDTSLIILHGQFPFSDVIDGFRNGTSLLQLAGLFNILSYTEYVGTTVDSPQVIFQDLAVGQNRLSETDTIAAPTSVPRDFNFVAVSLLQATAGNKFYPTDIKVINPSRSAQIKVERGRSALFTGLFHSTFAESDTKGLLRYKMSLQFSANTNAHPLLGFVDQLNYAGGHINYTAPQIPTGLNAIGASAQVFDATTNEVIYTSYQLGPWSGQLDLVALETLRQSGKKYRIEVSLHASSSNDIPNDHETLFETTELVTKNAIEI
ncbi:MAG: hypothetical protein M9899_03715 [Bdellovibrionaceae bacterium]|nr:hypothetical protein [Pseudobdellovibrionaceae bacterium]